MANLLLTQFKLVYLNTLKANIVEEWQAEITRRINKLYINEFDPLKNICHEFECSLKLTVRPSYWFSEQTVLQIDVDIFVSIPNPRDVVLYKVGEF